MKSYHSITQTLIFMVFSTVFVLLLSYLILTLLGWFGVLFSERWFAHGSNLIVALLVYLGAKVYPYKMYDEKGYIQGMHRGSLVIAGMLIFGIGPSMFPISQIGGRENPSHWFATVGLVSLLAALFAYWVMDRTLRSDETTTDKKSG